MAIARLRHRGPDWSGIQIIGNNAIVHERLAIVDPESGSQPLLSPEGDVILAVNGEIYNHEELRAELKREYIFSSRSDCEVGSCGLGRFIYIEMRCLTRSIS